MMRTGALIWTACAAGWFVIGVTLTSMEAVCIAIGCLICAAIWSEFGD